MRKKLLFLFFAAVILIGIYFYQERGGEVLGIGDSGEKLSITFLDIGQGDATLIRTPKGQDIIIDGGPDNSLSKKLGAYLPFGDRDIEMMILSHPHSDHITGLIEVLKYYTVRELITTGVYCGTSECKEFEKIIKEKNIPVRLIEHRQEIVIEDGVSFDVIFPDKSFSNIKMDNLNNASIVSRLIYASTSAMFSGDYENEELLSDQNINLKSDVYKVGHHGSNNANDKNFLEMVEPDFAVVSAGADNSFGHPHYRTIRNLEKNGTNIFRTDRDGDVTLLSNGLNFDLVK